MPASTVIAASAPASWNSPLAPWHAGPTVPKLLKFLSAPSDFPPHLTLNILTRKSTTSLLHTLTQPVSTTMSDARPSKRQRRDDGGTRPAQFARGEGPAGAAAVIDEMREEAAAYQRRMEQKRQHILVCEKHILSRGDRLPLSRPHRLLLPPPVGEVVRGLQHLRVEELKKEDGCAGSDAGSPSRAGRGHVKKEKGGGADRGSSRSRIKQSHVKKERVERKSDDGEQVLIKREVDGDQSVGRLLADIPEAKEENEVKVKSEV